MEEDSGRSAKKWYKSRIATYTILAVLVLCLLFVLVDVIGCVCGPGSRHPSPYSSYLGTKEAIYHAVQVHQEEHDGQLPTVNGTVAIDGADYYIVDMCALLIDSGGLLHMIPWSCTQLSGGSNDNCDGPCDDCDPSTHHIWVVDADGKAHLTLITGEDCGPNADYALAIDDNGEFYYICVNCEGCDPDAHYIWAVDADGEVYSTCVGGDCTASNTDGYQDVWP